MFDMFATGHQAAPPGVLPVHANEISGSALPQQHNLVAIVYVFGPDLPQPPQPK